MNPIRFLLAAFVLLAAANAAAAAPEITAARIGPHPDKTRFVIEMSADLSYKTFALANPDRIVIDLPAFDWRIPAGQMPRAAGMIKAVRPGQSKGRIVLDLARPAKISKSFSMGPSEGKPYRLVIDLTAVSRSAFAALAKQQPATAAAKLPAAPAKTPEPAPVPAPKPVVAAEANPVASKGAAPADPPLPEPKPRNGKPMIVIDAGHGGADPGATGVSGIEEKELTLEYALELKRILLETGRYRVQMTRIKDRFLKLKKRAEMAMEVEGDLFISIHANNHPSPDVRGASVYTLSEKASDAEAAALAKAENAADAVVGLDLSEQDDIVRMILGDLIVRESMNRSKQFANGLVRELAKDTRLLRNSHRFAGFSVLKSPTVPSILFEIGYLSNPREEREMRTDKHRRKISRAMARAIDLYFKRQEAYRRP